MLILSKIFHWAIYLKRLINQHLKVLMVITHRYEPIVPPTVLMNNLAQIVLFALKIRFL